MKNSPERSPEKSSKYPNFSSTSLMWRAGMSFFPGIALGLVLGAGTDKYFHTHPWGMVVMIILGAATGFWNMFRLLQSPSSGSQPLKEEGKERKND